MTIGSGPEAVNAYARQLSEPTGSSPVRAEGPWRGTVSIIRRGSQWVQDETAAEDGEAGRIGLEDEFKRDLDGLTKQSLGQEHWLRLEFLDHCFKSIQAQDRRIAADPKAGLCVAGVAGLCVARLAFDRRRDRRCHRKSGIRKNMFTCWRH